MPLLSQRLAEGWLIEGMDPGEGLARGASRADYRPRDPVRTTVPKIVQAALLEAGRVEDPYWERNNEKLLWIESKEWWYFLDFTAPASRGGARYEILFEGLAYLAEVWLDGASVGVFQGMFARRRIDATDFLRRPGRHRLTLRLRALPGSQEDRPGGSVLRGTVRNSGVVAPFTYWWNWAPHLVPIGIWKPVSLEVRGRRAWATARCAPPSRGTGAARWSGQRSRSEWTSRTAVRAAISGWRRSSRGRASTRSRSRRAGACTSNRELPRRRCSRCSWRSRGSGGRTGMGITRSIDSASASRTRKEPSATSWKRRSGSVRSSSSAMTRTSACRRFPGSPTDRGPTSARRIHGPSSSTGRRSSSRAATGCRSTACSGSRRNATGPIWTSRRTRGSTSSASGAAGSTRRKPSTGSATRRGSSPGRSSGWPAPTIPRCRRISSSRTRRT